MDTTSDIRRKNLEILINEAGGAARLAGKLGKSRSQLSQLTGNNPFRGLGSKLSREIEIKLNLEIGWMDMPHDLMSGETRKFIEKWEKLPPALRKQVENYVDLQIDSIEEESEEENTDFSRIRRDRE